MQKSLVQPPSWMSCATHIGTGRTSQFGSIERCEPFHALDVVRCDSPTRCREDITAGHMIGTIGYSRNAENLQTKNLYRIGRATSLRYAPGASGRADGESRLSRR